MDEINLHTKFYSGKDVHDLIIRHLSNDYHAALAAIRELSNIPAADVVEVVRCKDCEFNDDGYRCPFREAGWGYDPDRYCSFGERKEG